MKDICVQCKFPFNETSIQYYKRIKSKGKKICKDCSRISNAEKNFEVRKVKKSIIKEKVEPIIELIDRVHLYESINVIKKESHEKRLKKARDYWATKNGKEIIRNGWATRRARKYDAILELTKEEKIKIKEFYSNKPDGHHIDHIIPLCKGGKHCIENLQYLKASENHKKHAKIDIFMIEKISKGEKISTHLLMRRFKLTFDAAHKIMQEIN